MKSDEGQALVEFQNAADARLVKIRKNYLNSLARAAAHLWLRKPDQPESVQNDRSA